VPAGENAIKRCRRVRKYVHPGRKPGSWLCEK
jgi:hypothetical protein